MLTPGENWVVTNYWGVTTIIALFPIIDNFGWILLCCDYANAVFSVDDLYCNSKSKYAEYYLLFCLAVRGTKNAFKQVGFDRNFAIENAVFILK